MSATHQSGPHPRRTRAARRVRSMFVATVAVAVGLSLAAAPASGEHVPDDAGRGAVADPAAAATATPVTLITGDRVWLHRFPDGRQAAVFEPGDRSGGATFYETLVHDESVYVIPADAVPLVPAVLDRELFNITKLVDFGYYDGVPVILTPAARAVGTLAGVAAAGAAPGLTVTHELASIGGVAATVHPTGRWWEELTTQPGPAIATDGDGLAGIERVWLDGQVRATLADSVPQIGAPAAWAEGYDGTGMVVAVLDTGIDGDHPDLAGRVVAEANFSDSDTAGDRDGHGTHVAGTVAGSGAASGGIHTGVAPGAQLLNGKVLDDFGFGQDSWVIAGMEWAAGQGADVINMSLGGSPTDGTDPLSQALNQITAAHGVLFVVAAGNWGFEGSVTSPGAADAALTVGAVDRSDELASFSSRGPRVGDFAIKPDVTAPGVDIVAARAEGTQPGPIVDDAYTQLSGTSMAAPHVAGAAAILRQQSPDLDPAALKAVLTTTAVPHDDLDIFDQGGGRIDIAAALGTPVHASPAPLDFGFFRYPQADVEPVTETVTYTNQGAQPVSLALTADLRDQGGSSVPAGAVEVSPDQVTLAPGGSAQVAVTLDVSRSEPGRYGGYLTASDVTGEVILHTPTGFYQEPESYDLTVHLLDRNGQSAGDDATVAIVNVADAGLFHATPPFSEPGTVRARVPAGTYGITGHLADADFDGGTLELAAVVEPEVEVAGDITIVLDGSEAQEVTVAVEGEVTAAEVSLTTYRGTEQGGVTALTFGGTGFAEMRLYARPTDPVTIGEFEFYTQHMLFGDGTLYELVLPEPDAIPADLHYQISAADVVTIVNNYHSHLPGQTFMEFRSHFRPWSDFANPLVREVAAPVQRIEYLSAGDTAWAQMIEVDFLLGTLAEPPTTYRAGETLVQGWFQQPVRPGWVEGAPSTRSGDMVLLPLREFIDADGHFGSRDPGFFGPSVDTVALRLFQDGQLIDEAPAAFTAFQVASQPAQYRLELDVTRDADWWVMSPHTSTAWEFSSGPPAGGGSEVLPLLRVDYDIELDLQNTAPHPQDRRGPATMELQVRHQPGLADSPAIAGARVWMSFDDGDSWQRRPLQSLGDGGYQVVLPQPDPAQGAGYVSLRVEAWDADDNRIEQEITRAWRLAAR